MWEKVVEASGYRFAGISFESPTDEEMQTRREFDVTTNQGGSWCYFSQPLYKYFLD
jgi:hypothetical protein